MEDHNHDDIAAYIEDTLTEMDSEDVPSEDSEIEQSLMKKLIKQANGSFQWAQLIIPLAQRKILEGESFYYIDCWLQEAPHDLEETYSYILCNVIQASNREQSLLLFQWVCLAERPLTVTEMRYALAVSIAQLTPSSNPKAWVMVNGYIESNERMTRRIKTLSGGLVEVVVAGDDIETIQLVHQSVIDFLRTKGLRLLLSLIDSGRWHVDDDSENILLRSQEILYQSCLAYIAGVHIPEEKRNLYESDESLFQNHPFLAYATVNAFIHMEKAAVSRLGLSLNDEVVDQWVQIYNMLNYNDLACPAYGTKLLHVAAAAGLSDLIESLGNEDVDTNNDDTRTAFHLAAREGQVLTGQKLLEKGADREAEDTTGMTPLIEAARNGQTRFVQWPFQVGANLERKDGSGAALHEAVLRGHYVVIEILLAAGAVANAQGGEYGNALQAAAFEGNNEIVQLLLNFGANVNAQGCKYGNALQLAAYKGNTETVQLLLDSGANTNVQGGGFGDALQASAFGGNPETVQLLLDHGANINTQGGEYGNSLQIAASTGNTEVVQLLLDSGADINAQSGEYGSAFDAAIKYERTEVVELLQRCC